MFQGLFQPTHLIIVLVIVLIIFGPGKLPQVGGSIGRSIAEFRRSVSFGSESQPTAEAAPEPAATVRRVCPSCHTESAQGNEFCGRCGAKLA